ncbi:MAG: aminotransferase class III-fold pyridoxal phosphate-dependent enzyme [Elusimicrobia bacterium]|nr:aminotransferase class III-fold pyridoxal phosphate-dependent enzyme [Elusimicrobiota bacterium]
MVNPHEQSQNLLKRALKVIPLGAQTFSKSITQYPLGISPHFATHARGSKIWDVDGNEYIDFVNALAAVTLGYGDPDVIRAVQDQMERGSLFSLSHPLEIDVAEALVEMVPCAEMVRFGKNGSDVTTAAVRLSRAFTQRDHVALCGYHGWQDWSIGTTARRKGVPEPVSRLSHPFNYNDLDSLHHLFNSYPDQIAAVILEPMSIEFPRDGFLQGVRDLCNRHKSVMIFDEVVTGFRLARGGAQELFGVTPDLACFGKGMANGFPLSAIVGREELMRLLEEVFFSFTFGGDVLSLAAARATLKKVRNEPVVEELERRGRVVMEGAQRLLQQFKMEQYISLSGHPSWSFLRFHSIEAVDEWEMKTLFLQEVFARGVLTIGTHNMSYAHTQGDLDRLLAVYAEVFSVIAEAVRSNGVAKRLRCEALKPLFKLRG